MFGGDPATGIIFRLNTDGSDFTVPYSFSKGTWGGPIPWRLLDSFVINTDGAWPSALVLSGDRVYGTTYSGGYSGSGTVFAVNTDGTGFTSLYSFSSLTDPFRNTNRDGVYPNTLVLSGNTLYGTAAYGGSFGYGVIFALNTDGTGFTNLYDFNGWTGAGPSALILSGSTLYGTTQGGGGTGSGTGFAVNTDGTGFALLHIFAANSNNSLNSDGACPAALVLSGNTIYGTAGAGGTFGYGALFSIRTDGTGFTNLYNFNGASDGAGPYGGLALSGNTLYGSTFGSAAHIYAQAVTANGTIFSISFTPQLTITPSGSNAILTWPTNYAGFDYTGFTLQSTTNLLSPKWTTNLPAPVVVNGQNTITNPLSGTQQFFRLSQ
jgi:uncharacterized repeat protein (TIGR03803 family)